MAELFVYNHQQALQLPQHLIAQWATCANLAIPKVLELAKSAVVPLMDLQELEVSLVDDATIADIHLRFMDIPGATDVITFDHGEIHISVETAAAQAAEFGNDFEREVMLYIIHGLLHLAGYEDGSDEQRAVMDDHQQRILNELWSA